MRYLIYDDDCNFCCYVVKLLMSLVDTSVIIFISFKSSKGKELINDYNIRNVNSVIYIDHQDKIFTKANAVLKICRMMKFPYNLFYVFNILPNRFLNFIYDFIAKNRMRIK